MQEEHTERCKLSGTAVVRIFVGLCACATIISAGCRGPRSKPFDPTDALYSLDFMPTQWFYRDQDPLLHTRLDCWSNGGRGPRMELETGTYVYRYEFTSKTGERLVFERNVAVTGFLNDEKNPFKWPEGEYDARVSVTTPSGKIVDGGYVRQVRVYRRELRLTLTADKPVYRVGELITLTARVENVSGQDLSLEKFTNASIRFTDGNDWMDVKYFQVPKALKKDEACQLFALSFTAGEADNRFVKGGRWEDYPVPFGRIGEYRMNTSLQLCMPKDTQKQNTNPPVRSCIKALPGAVVLQVIKREQ